MRKVTIHVGKQTQSVPGCPVRSVVAILRLPDCARLIPTHNVVFRVMTLRSAKLIPTHSPHYRIKFIAVKMWNVRTLNIMVLREKGTENINYNPVVFLTNI
jgi:hypothetical protein